MKKIYISDPCARHHSICNILILSDFLEFADSLFSIPETSYSSNSSSASTVTLLPSKRQRTEETSALSPKQV